MNCGICGQPGHNSRSCLKTTADRLASKASYMRRYRAGVKRGAKPRKVRGLSEKNDRLFEA